MRAFKNAWFKRFVRKEKISAAALWEAVDRAEQGQINADLGSGVIKQRIARSGRGKSNGYRTIILYCKGDKAFFVFGFPKNEQDNIREDEEIQFKKMAKQVLALTDEQLQQLIANGQFEEIVKNA
ncbi:type II toxin-antitoxin system RelE/ParE family toxin [Aquaspirillum serpens]|uniref:type II toxin-antitoxin system RelE/ParE family toxin n=1 Tax=Aquaspirillum serpens TaxID=190 RepID=UPI0003B4679C|nr:type II toxin-antitoxin system RelE/ParE family toxin [Aquaspirillum serpens]